MTPHNLYIHVPYCASKCNYCAFYSICLADWAGYEQALVRDLEFWGWKLGRIRVPTLFFGGGTPSLMPTDAFARIMGVIRKTFDIASDAEITLESNPGTVDRARLVEFNQAGVNRLSIGVQAMDDARLAFLGRKHSARDACDLIETAHDMGLRVNGDFIYGLPGQTAQDVRKMCDGILALGLMHASCYELSVDPGTPFAKMNLQLPDQAMRADMYQTVLSVLSPRLKRYEVSNYAAAGFECRHNAHIWAGDPYLGVGPAAAGRVLQAGQWFEQSNIADVKKWLIKNDWDDSGCARMTDRDRGTEKILTGLRTARGVLLTSDVRARINWRYIQNNPDLFDWSDSFLALTDRGLLILDALLPDTII
jgi:oxygen-independent coproporphyrinogen-3 oxidase